MATQAGSIEPAAPLEPERPPQKRQSPQEWARENLFSSWFNSILTVIFAALLAWLIYVFARFVFVNAEWTIIEVNLTNLLVFDFPRDELWRVWLVQISSEKT